LRASGTTGPHAVKAIAGAKTAAYCYDLNGDLTSGDGRTVVWSAFGMPTNITKGRGRFCLLASGKTDLA
jgi:hypothetical protein